MSAIFISHSSQDNQAAEDIGNWLAEQGHRSVFLDFDPAKGIPAGRNWEQELYQRIRICRAVIVLCSKESMASRWCFMEITHARALGKHLFPVKVGECDIEGVLTDRQVIDLTADREAALQRLWHGIISAGLDPADAFDWDGSRSPYPGLLAFQEDDAAIFFGRDDETTDGLALVNRVRQLGQTKLIMVLGASGSGKSSLVRAGLVPRLRRDSERWLVVDPFRPRDDGARGISIAISRAFDQVGHALPWEHIYQQIHGAMARLDVKVAPIATMENEARQAQRAEILEQIAALEVVLSQDPYIEAAPHLRRLRAALDQDQGLRETGVAGVSPPGDENDILGALADDLLRHRGRDDAKVLLLIDQFEELLEPDDDHPNSRFLGLLRHALDRPDGSLIALVTMRSDFLEQFQNSPALLDVRYESLLVGPLSAADVGQVIEKPARLAAIDLEPGLVQALVTDAETDDALPLLAFTLRELYERYGENGRLEMHEYQKRLGGLQGAVAKAADEILKAARVDSHLESKLRTAFLAMVRITDEGNYARRVAHWEDLPHEAHQLLETFVVGRLLVAGSDEHGRTLEVAHEALFRSWGRLVHWLDESAEALRLRREIQQAANSWSVAGRAEEDLLTGGRLARSREMVDNGDLPLSALDREFVEASYRAERAMSDAREVQRQKELRRNRVVTAGVSALSVVALGFAFYAFSQTRIANGQKAIAQEQTAVAEERLEQSRRGAYALQITRASLICEGGAKSAANVLGDYTTSPFYLRDFSWGYLSKDCGTTEANPNVGLIADEEAARVAYSPNGQWLAVVTIERGPNASSGEIILIDRRDKSVHRLGSISGWPSAAAFSPDSGMFAVAAGEVKGWNMETKKAIVILEEDATSLAWSADSERLAIGQREALTVWTASDRKSRSRATCEEDRSKDVYCEQTSRRVHSIAFAPDGQSIATGHDGKVRLWAADSLEWRADLEGHSAAVLGMAFIRGGEELISISRKSEGKAGSGQSPELIAWNMKTRLQRSRIPLEPDIGVAYSLHLSPDGRTLATGHEEGRVWLWDPITLQRRLAMKPHDGGHVRHIALSPDGQEMLSVVTVLGEPNWAGLTEVKGEEVRLSSAADWRGSALLSGHIGRVYSIAFAPGSRTLVSGSGYDGGNQTHPGEVMLWDILSGAQRLLFREHDNQVQALAFAPSGDRLAMLAQRSFKVINVGDGSFVNQEDMGKLQSPSLFFGSASYSPDGKALLRGDGSIFDASSGKIRVKSPGIFGSNIAAYAPDGSFIAINGDEQHRVLLYDSQSPILKGELLGHSSQVRAIVISPDSQTVAAGGKDGTVRLWDVADPRAPPFATLNDHDVPVQSLAFSPDGKYLVVGGGPTDTVASQSNRAPPGELVLWNVETKTPTLIKRLAGHSSSVFAVAFSSDGEYLASGGAGTNSTAGGELRLWHMATVLDGAQ